MKTLNFKRLTEEKLEDMGWKAKDLQKSLKIPERTYYRRLKEPGRMTVNQMRQWAEVLHFTAEEKLEIMQTILR